MPRGDAAIFFKYVTARWEGGAALRKWRSIGLESLRSEKIKGLIANLKENRAARKVPLLVVLGISLVSLGFMAMRRGVAKSSAPGVVLVPRYGGGRSSTGHVPSPVAPKPPVNVKTRTFSADYKVLLLRSMFAIGGRPLSGRSASAAMGAAAPASRETTLFLKGISQEDARFSAFVEDATAKRIVEAHVGDVLGNGRISDMTLRDLGYEVDGKVMRIEIGNGLNGSSAGMPMPSSQVASGALGKSGRRKHHSDVSGDAHASTLGDGH
jgi:hypothetical protein